MVNVEFVKVDELNVDQLEIGDLIQINDDIVQVCEVVSLANGYVITIENEFGEKDVMEFDDNETFNWYILRDDDVE